MHPILAHRSRLVAFAAVWAPLAVIAGVAPAWVAGTSLWTAWPLVVWTGALAIPALASWHVCRFSPLQTAPMRVVATIGAASLAVAAMWLGAGWVWLQVASALEPATTGLADGWAIPALGLAVAAFAVMAAVHYAIDSTDHGRDALRRALEAEVAAKDAELRALRAQVNPHFLFNCLHSISALAGSDPVAARRMCLELADFFRDSLRAGTQLRVPLAVEAALVRQYLDIERVRFGDRLIANLDLAPDARGLLVPALLLQPLAENAVRHGIATMVEGGTVTIVIARTGTAVRVTVDNPYDPDGRRGGTGLGLANVRARLESTYGSRASLSVDTTGARFRATLEWPAEEAA